MKRTTRRRVLMAIAALPGVLFVGKAVCWAWAGRSPEPPPVLHVFEGVEGRRVTASSDRVIEQVFMMDDRDLPAWFPKITTIIMGPRVLTFSADRVKIDSTTWVDLPAACREVELIVRRDELQVLGDGEPLPQVGPAPSP